MDTLDIQILRYISESLTSVSFRHLHRHFQRTYRLDPKRLKQAVGRLVQAGQLYYRTDFGSSYLDIAINGPVKVSEHIFLKPAMCASGAGLGQWDVVLEKGAAFGRGDHPTTRLAIQLIDGLLHEKSWQKKRNSIVALDIGTGSGVLAIAAAKMGVGRIQAVDIDPCAVFEARANAQLNGVEKQMLLIDDLRHVARESCDLIFANLRTPTLMSVFFRIMEIAVKDSMLIFSGMRAEEAGQLCDKYRTAGFVRKKMITEKNWSALILARGEFGGDSVQRIPHY